MLSKTSFLKDQMRKSINFQQLKIFKTQNWQIILQVSRSILLRTVKKVLWSSQGKRKHLILTINMSQIIVKCQIMIVKRVEETFRNSRASKVMIISFVQQQNSFYKVLQELIPQIFNKKGIIIILILSIVNIPQIKALR